MDLTLVHRLTTGEGASLLASLPPYAESTATTLGVRLREAGFDADLVAAALTQSRLRDRAVDKLGPFAAQMLFTSDGLQQATRLAVAAQHAERFRSAGVGLVHDLGCGIGADALAIAGLGMAVRAVDSDPVTAAIAAHNLRHVEDAQVRCARAEDIDVAAPAGAGVWVDPARRVAGVADISGRPRRVSGLEAISPPWSQVQRWADIVPAVGAKLAPAFPHGRIPAGAEAQWTSWAGEVVECAIWFGPLARTSGRTALVAGPDRPAVAISEADGATAAPPLRPGDAIGDWLYDPDRAVVRAGLTAALAAAVDGAEVGDGAGYVTSERCVAVSYARRYAVREALPLDIKTVRIWLRDHDVGTVTIKKRGVAVDPDRLRTQLRLSGSAEATLVLCRVGARSTALVVEPR
jgi:hypothetical protein